MPRADAPHDFLHRRYADLLPAEPEDPALTGVVHDLDAFMAAPSPASAQRRIGRELLAQATERYQGVGRHSAGAFTDGRPGARRLAKLAKGPEWMPSWARRPAVAAAVALLAVLVFSGGVAYAVTRLDPGLRFQLGVPAASGPEYTDLHLSRVVGGTTVTLAKAAFTSKQVVVGYTYDRSAEGPGDTGHDRVCAVSLTSSEGDTFRATVGDILPVGVKDGVAHGSTVLYFAVDHLQGGQRERHLHLVLQPCDSPQAGDAVAFDFTVPLQQ